MATGAKNQDRHDASMPIRETHLPPRFVLHSILRYLKPLRILLGLAAVLMVANRGLALAIPRIISEIIDSATDESSTSSLDRTALILIAVFVASAILQFCSAMLFAWVGEKLVLAIRSDVFSHMMSLSIDFFRRRRVAELLSRVAGDTTVVQNAATTFPVNLIKQLVTFIGGVILIGALNLRLTIVLVACLPGVALATWFFGGRIRRLSTQVQDEIASSNIIVEEAISGIETVKSFAREGHEGERYESRLGHAFRRTIQRAFYSASHGSSVTLLFFGGLAAALWYAARMIESGELTTGKLVAFMLYTVLVGNSFTGLAALWAQWQRLMGAGRRVFQILLEVPSVADRPDAEPFSGDHQVIRFDNVGFAYPTHPDRTVLQDISFTVRRGEVIALVGESGAGKSTIVTLLLRHYDVADGAITIDGRDLRDLPQRDLRDAIAFVPQDIVVFGRSLRENIAYGKLDASDSEIEAAARAAHALEFIERTPRGFDTLAGDRGVILSGGERQRIAIARALLRNPPILVLDEATSALDRESEALVKDAIESLMAERTTFVIAHRLSTIEQADRVLVVHRGRLVESGTHAELLQRDGQYARLYHARTWGTGG